MAKGNPYLKKATGAAKAPASVAGRKHGLGRKVDFGAAGVDGLLGRIPSAPPPSAGQALELPLAELERSPFQPRREFSEAELKELAESLRNNGLVQPPTVRRNAAGRYELVCGERRVRAAQLLGWKKIRVTLIEANDLTAAAMTTTENCRTPSASPSRKSRSASARAARRWRTRCDFWSCPTR